MLEFYVDSLITIHFFNYHGGVIISDLMINGQIRDKEVRLIANDGEQLGVMSAREAQKLADEAGLDLVKISPKAKPPVCKRVKVTLRFRGRELAHVNASKYILDDFAKALEDVATIDKKPKFEGRSMTMFLAPKNN